MAIAKVFVQLSHTRKCVLFTINTVNHEINVYHFFYGKFCDIVEMCDAEIDWPIESTTSFSNLPSLKTYMHAQWDIGGDSEATCFRRIQWTLPSASFWSCQGDLGIADVFDALCMSLGTIGYLDF